MAKDPAKETPKEAAKAERESKVPKGLEPKVKGNRLHAFKFPENTPVAIRRSEIAMSSPDNNRPGDPITQLMLHGGHQVKINGEHEEVLGMIDDSAEASE